MSTSESLLVYPNPFYDFFTITFNKIIPTKAEIVIFKGTGRRVFQQDYYTISNAKITVAPINLNSGIYYVRINFENGSSESIKIIKK